MSGEPEDLFDPEELNFDMLQPPDWLRQQFKITDRLGPVNSRQLMDLVIESRQGGSALDESGSVNLGNVVTLHPTKTNPKASKGTQDAFLRQGCVEPRSPRNQVRLVTAEGQRLKTCTRCKTTKPLSMFDPHKGSADGRQAYCKKCKSELNTLRRENSAEARLKHHIASRCIKQLGGKDKAPSDLTTKLELHLGYTMAQLVSHLDTDIRSREKISLAEAFRRGYHMDHKHPLSRYKVESVGDAEFRACWSLSNLWMIPASDNLQKGARIDYDRPER